VTGFAPKDPDQPSEGNTAVPRRTSAAAVTRLLACAVVVLLAGACTAGPSQSPPILVNDGRPAGTGTPPPSSSTPVPLPPLESGQVAALRWSDCDDTVLQRIPQPRASGLQCARFSVPMDSPAAPGRGQERLTVLKAGSGPAPLVVVNDIGGEPGTVYAAELAKRLPKELLSKVSLIGIDRRGTGSSDPVRCVPPAVRTAYLGSDPATLDVAGLNDQAGTAGQQCIINLENQLLALDTVRSAEDLDELRQVLGLTRLSAIGHGEGSRVLEMFADRNPANVGRLVLDGAPEPSQDAEQALTGVADGAEATFKAFAADCVARTCALGADPRATLFGLLDQVRAKPLTDSTGNQLGPGEVLEAVLAALGDRPHWPQLADALAKARADDGSGIETLLRPLMADDRDDPPRFDVATVTTCNDTKTRLSPDRIVKVAADWQNRFPLFGTVIAKRLVLCSPWTVATAPPGPMAARGAPPILVLGTASDPVTPLSGTEHAATALATGVLVTWQGAGHGALASSDCALAAAKSFLADGTVPHDGTVCPP
jgi:pimeloyl-ACP methyl ester carboxylesterase